MTTTDALQKAVDYLGAVEVAPGRYAFKVPFGKVEGLSEHEQRDIDYPATTGWRVTSTGDLNAVIDISQKAQTFPERLFFLLDDSATTMPSDWEPGDPLPQTVNGV
jgi:hypothetical protein